MRFGGLVAMIGIGGCGSGDVDTELGEVVELSQAEYDALDARGTFYEVGELDPNEERARIDALEAEATEVVEALVLEYPEWERLLRTADRALVDTLPDGNHEVDVGGVRIQLQGEGLHRRSVAHTIERTSDPAARREVLERLLVVVPQRCRDLATSRSERSSMDLEELRLLESDVARCWDDWRTLVRAFPGGARGDLRSSLEGVDEPENCWVDDEVCACKWEGEVDIGEGNDETGHRVCEVPSSGWVTGWELFEHLSPVKNQRRRGTCVAFAMASAIESNASLLTGNAIDVSEQYLYSIGKFDLYHESLDDGLPLADFATDLSSEGWSIPLEPSWGYNPSPCRRELQDSWYDDSCVGYDDKTCSETSHQLGLYMGPDTGLLWYRPDPGGDYAKVGLVLQLLDYGWPNFESIRAITESGFGVVASIDVTEDFRSLYDRPSGLLDYEIDDDFVGRHAVHVVRVVYDSGAPGGGYVVVKNSWGCGWGDQGYGYLSFEWFWNNVNSVDGFLTVARVNTPPQIEITSPTDNVVTPLSPLGHDITLTAEVSDAEDGSDCCDVSWWSPTLGTLGEGTSVEVRLTKPGVHVFRASVRDSEGGLTDAAVLITLTNDAPTARIDRPAAPSDVDTTEVFGRHIPLNTPVVVDGLGSDPNQPAVLCDSYTWTLDGAVLPEGDEPCTAELTLTETGWHKLELTVVDNVGAEGQDVRWVRGVEWSPRLPPFVWINAPARARNTYWDNELVVLDAAARSGLERTPVERVWKLVVDRETVEVIGEGSPLVWVADAAYHDATLVLEATDPNGTSRDSVRIRVDEPPQ
ncbi:MAG: C1 family peptidase [Myxococcales bacterium]|nr:C1 family peptidase [Myxococcales bacterium]